MEGAATLNFSLQVSLIPCTLVLNKEMLYLSFLWTIICDDH